MSKLDDLIAELCPDGVEYKMLGDVTGYSLDRIDAKEVDSHSYVGVDNLLPAKLGKTDSNYLSTEGRLTRFSKGDILIGNIRPYLKKIWLATHGGGTNGDVLVIQANDRKVTSPEYLFYVLSSDMFFLYDTQNAKGAKMPRGDKTAVMKYPVPVPPLPVQQEIVRILDKFTTLEREMETELETELEARKKQYEYYLKSLFINRDYQELRLGDICVIQSGGTPSKGKSDYWINGTVKWLGSTVCKNQKSVSEVTALITEVGLKESSAKLQKKDTTLIALVGATIGKVAFLPFEAAINQNIAALYPIDPTQLNESYLFYACRIQYERFINLTKEKFTMANLSFVRNLTIPVPSLEEQQRIVAILDRFDALVNDITQGLPAEIAARRRQYEYYRDKLLTFKEKVL